MERRRAVTSATRRRQSRKGHATPTASTTGQNAPIPCSLWQPDGVHRPSAVLFPERFPWYGRGLGRRCRAKTSSFTNCTSATFTPEGTFDAVIPRLDALRDLGVTAVEIHAGGPVPRRAQLGLRRRSPLRPAEHLRRPARPAAAGGRLPRPRPGGLPRRGLQPPRPGRQLPPANSVPTLPTATRRPGGRPSTTTAPAATPCAISSSTTCGSGSRLPLRRPAARRRSRHLRRQPSPHPPRDQGDGGRGGGPVRKRAVIDRPRAPERRAAAAAAGARRLRPRRRVERRLPLTAVHAYLTGERHGYYVDFGAARDFARLLEQTFILDGVYSQHRGRRCGAPAGGLPGDRFVGQRPERTIRSATGRRGERLAALVRSAGAAAGGQPAAAGAAPAAAVHGRGVRRGSTRSCSSAPLATAQLMENVREGRQRDYGLAAWQARVPDPQAEATFAASRLSWSWPEGSPRAGLRRLFHDLLAARRRWPALRDFVHRSGAAAAGRGQPVGPAPARGQEPGDALHAYFNLTDAPIRWTTAEGPGCSARSRSATAGRERRTCRRGGYGPMSASRSGHPPGRRPTLPRDMQPRGEGLVFRDFKQRTVGRACFDLESSAIRLLPLDPAADRREHRGRENRGEGTGEASP